MYNVLAWHAPVMAACARWALQVSALNAVMDSITPYMRKTHIAYRFGEHVVVMGHSNHKNVKAFVDEFFSPGARSAHKGVAPTRFQLRQKPRCARVCVCVCVEC